MNEARVYADGFERSFAEVKDLLEFLAERGRNAKWIRKPTNTLRLAPLEKEAQNLDAADASMEEILEDTEKNTQLVLKMRGESYPVRDCAIRTILSRAGVNGDGLRKLDKATYAKVVNYCLRVAKGDALIKIADGKVSAVHGGDKHDYCILDMKAMFETTCEYLNLNFKGSVYMEGSGIYDHSIVSAMWKLGGSQELLDTYRKALDAHGMDEKILSPALRFTTSDVAASGANLYPMLLTDGPNGVISLGSPIKLAHDKGATILDFRKNLEQVCARYVDAMKNLTQLMDIEIRNPVNCLKLLMKELGIKQKIRNEVVELFVSQNGEGACTAHDLYYAMNEASFFAACEGMSGQGILKLEEDITKALIKDWKNMTFLELPTTLMDLSVMDNAMARMMLETINNMMLELYASMAQAELEKKEKRQREGIEAKKLRGEWDDYGRPSVMKQETFDENFQSVVSGETTPTQLRKNLGMTHSTFYRYRKTFYEKYPELSNSAN